jgi:hypothetical protein
MRSSWTVLSGLGVLQPVAYRIPVLRRPEETTHLMGYIDFTGVLGVDPMRLAAAEQDDPAYANRSSLMMMK